MPGRLGANLRRGHLAEDLGVFFLRSFCAVADLRQEDDFGIDAVATLLRRRGRVLYAEESFAVQVKAVSVEEIDYEEEELEWLLKQRLPLFFLTVDLNEGTFGIYTASPVYELLPRQQDVHSAKLLMTLPQAWHSRVKLTESHADAYLGPPILSTEIGKLSDGEELGRIYDLMKVWVTSEISQTGLRALGKSRCTRWATWEEPRSAGLVSHGSLLDLRRDMKVVEPYVSYLADHIVWCLDDPSLERAFLTLKDWFEEFGVETDLDEDELRGQMRSMPLTREELLTILEEAAEDT
ncbi:MAG: hypothetical protein ACOC6F_04355 [bacterium]